MTFVAASAATAPLAIGPGIAHAYGLDRPTARVTRADEVIA